MDPRPDVLLVEDDTALRSMLVRALPDVEFRQATTAEEALGLLDPLPDLVLTDIHLGPGADGIELARRLLEAHPSLPVLVMTAFGDLSLAVKALRAGAWDFITKPVDLDLISSSIRRAAETHALRREVRRLRRSARITQPFGELVGESEPMRQLFGMLERVAGVSSSVLVQGESGTGKELVARALHVRSGRAQGPFVALNCAAVPESLLESELFGHARGAFTDAHADRDGLVVQANRGTLFLDEIGDMPMAVQAKLLRVLQERTVRPVGAAREVGVDVRVVAATHRDLDALVEQGAFREDLLYRLDVFRLEVPPLRERGGDVLLIAQRFVDELAQQLDRPARGLSPEAAARLLDHGWPGNVRELRNAIERAVVLCEHDRIEVGDLPPKVTRARALKPVAAQPTALVPLADVERRHILGVLEAVDGHRGKAAEVLQIDRKTLYRKLLSYGVEA